MYQNLQEIFWWLGIKKEVSEFVYTFLTYHKSKIEHKKSYGLMQPLSIPEWKWDIISMDFMVGLPRRSKGSDLIWVVVDRLTKSTHLILIKISYLLQKLAHVYISEIVKLHGIL